jgi:hypothetical protein
MFCAMTLDLNVERLTWQFNVPTAYLVGIMTIHPVNNVTASEQWLYETPDITHSTTNNTAPQILMIPGKH